PWDATYIVFDPEGVSQSLELEASNLDDLFVVSSTAAKAVVRGRGVLREEPVFVELRDQDKVYRGTYRPAATARLELSDGWTVTVDAPTVRLPYADIREDALDHGMRDRWFEVDSDSPKWGRLWLSPMNYAMRKWNVIGPFPNPEDAGLAQHFPPEQEIQY